MDSTKLKSRALELKKQGLSYQQIADQLQVGKTTVYNWLVVAPKDPLPDTTSVFSNEKEDLASLKQELAELRSSLSAEESAMIDTGQLVELRKLEMEHEYQMEELDNKRKDASYEAEIEGLNNQIKELKAEKEHSQTCIYEQTERIDELQHRLEPTLERNAELEEKVSAMNNQYADHTDEATDDIPNPFLPYLVNLTEEYLRLDGEECRQETIDSISTRLDEIVSEIESWALANHYDFASDELSVIIDSLTKDIHESLETFEKEEANELVLNFDEEWKREMEEWLELFKQ